MKVSILFSLGATGCTLAAVLEPLHARQSNWTIGQTVNTTSGPVSGHPGSNASAVSEYLGIPFAKPPLGDLRFAPPQAFNGTAAINGTSYGFSCPIVQGSSRNASVYTAANITSQGLQILAALGQIGQTFSEDCLTLNVWTKPQTGDAKKAVLVWIYGGGFASGSSSSVQYSGQNIADQEDVIVVTLNYRVNVFGFPGNPAGTNNLGLLDQRLALEWVRDNVEAFGGDTSRITIFGQSAGGASVDYYNYAWVDDPIVAGFIPESGTVFSFGLPNQAEFSANAWFNLTTNLGCGNSTSDAATVLACARTKNTTEILDAIPPSSGTQGVLGYFGPTVDNTVVFSNYTARSAAGNFTKKPLLIGNNNYEAGLFVTTFALQGISYPPLFWDIFNLQEFTCPAGIRANASVTNNVPTWRYRYFGDFPDLTIAPGSGAWHGSELPLLFDVTPTSPPATDAEIAIGNYMRGAWAAFAKDPVNGLNNYEGGWPQYVPGQETLIRLAYDNATGTNLASPYTYDAGCSSVNVSSTDTSGVTGNSTSTGASGTSSGSVTTPTTTSGSSRINVSLVGVFLSILVFGLLL